MDINEVIDIYQKIRKIDADSYLAGKDNRRDPYQSENTNELNAALAKAQSEYESVGMDRENPYFKNRYATLHEVIKCTRQALTKHGLAFVQQEVLTDDGSVELRSQLRHSSGQFIESRARVIPLKNDPQTYGSTLTYKKRYSAMALLGVTASEDPDDDDGEVAMIPARQTLAKGPSNQYNPKVQSSEVISKDQLDELEYELQNYDDLAEDILDKLHLQSLKDLPKSMYGPSIKRIRDIKRTREGLK